MERTQTFIITFLILLCANIHPVLAEPPTREKIVFTSTHAGNVGLVTRWNGNPI